MSAAATNEVSTRALLEASWHATQRYADENGAASMIEAAYAGKMLELADGDPVIAVTLLPFTEGTYWGAVADYLQRVAQEEG